MKAYKRRSKSTLHQTVARHAAGHPGAPKASILVSAVPAFERQSLLRMQQGFAGLLRNRELLSQQYAGAVQKGQTERANRLARKLADTTAKAQTVALEIANRMPAPVPLAETGKPERKRARTTRSTKMHSKVRYLSPTILNATV